MTIGHEQEIRSGTTIRVAAPLETVPIFVRGGRDIFPLP